MTLHRIERDAQASRRQAGVCDELRELRINAQARVLEIDRVDRVSGDRHLDACTTDNALTVEGDESRQSPPRLPVIHAVEIDPADLFTSAVRVRDARTQAPGDERQVRVRVAWLDGALCGIEITAAFEAVVRVAGAFREERAERVDVPGDALRAETRRQTAIEEARGRVERPIEAMVVGAERLVFS